MKKTSNAPQLLLPQDYIDLATELTQVASRRIYVLSLSLTRCQATDKLVRGMLTAAKRGVSVHAAADLLTFIWNRGGQSELLSTTRRYSTDRLRRDFRQAGAQFRWLGLQRIPYLLGRTHSKWLVVDDDVFAFGGVNLDQAGLTERTDYMFHLRDPKIADSLMAEQHLIEQIDQKMRRVRDRLTQTDYGTILFDSGQFGKSIIYQHAIEIARTAQSLIIVTQYCPTGKLNRLLRTKNCQLYFNPKGSATDAINNLMIGSKEAVAEQFNLYKHDSYLHAKFIVATMADGSKKALTGSHNFTALGVRTGTREIALETTNPAIISQLENFYIEHVK